MKKTVLGVFLVLFVFTIIFVLVSGDIPTSTNTDFIPVVTTMSAAALMFALNFLGLDVLKMFYGTIGMLIALTLLGYGIYVLVKKNTIFQSSAKMVPIVGGIATGIGGLGVLTSAGVMVL